MYHWKRGSQKCTTGKEVLRKFHENVSIQCFYGAVTALYGFKSKGIVA